MQDILKQIRNERHSQDHQWGGAKNDDSNGAVDWLNMILKQLPKFMAHGPLAIRRSALIRVAAVCVAAIQSIDRLEAGKVPGMEKDDRVRSDRDTEIKDVYSSLDRGEITGDQCTTLIKTIIKKYNDPIFLTAKEGNKEPATLEPIMYPEAPGDKVSGYLEIGENDKGEIVINLPEDMTGHLCFSVNQARNLANSLMRQTGMTTDAVNGAE